MRRLSTLAAITLAAAIASSAHAQVLRKGAQDRPETPATPGAAAPVVPAPNETAGQTRREGRQEAREAREEARAVGESRPEARQTARDSRQGTRANIQANRAADFGLWFNTRGTDGLVISDLSDNGMFTSAGFREGDRIVSINGQPITTETQFVQYLTGPDLGNQPVQIVVIRGGQQQTLVLQPTVLTQGVVAYDPLYQYGIVIDDRNPNQIVIQRVYPRTPAYYAGLRAGDVITTIGGQRITGVDVLTQSLTNADAAIGLQVARGGQTRDIQLDVSQSADASARTALRPNFDAAARGDATIDARGQAGAGRLPDSSTSPPRTPDSALAPARIPDTGPVAPAAPQAVPAPTRPTPASPATPGRTGAAPATPAIPAAPAPGGISVPPQKTGTPTPTNPNGSAAPNPQPPSSSPRSGTGGTGGAGSTAGATTPR